jgi:N-acetyl sugar amidotransferase
MDTSAPDIEFGPDGICNYCTEYLQNIDRVLAHSPEELEARRTAFLKEVKAAGRGKRYDCVMGVSGGADSSWAVFQACKLGLRPLAVHMDNGWDSELAQENIENLVRKLGVDLYTHVIDWDEYRDLQQAFFDADVVDIELLYDNAMLAVNYQQAAANRVKHILAGSNWVTEGMRMPAGWAIANKYDKKNMFSIWRTFGDGRRLKTFPALGIFEYLYYVDFKRIRWVYFLDFFEYHKPRAMAELEREIGFRPYPYKHYESVFTRFYQGHILPEKFGADKRRVHLSTLVAAGQMERDEALKLLNGIPYPSQEDLEADIQYFLKKMGWSRSQLDDYLNRPEKPHELYGTEQPLWNAARVAKRYVQMGRRLIGRCLRHPVRSLQSVSRRLRSGPAYRV